MPLSKESELASSEEKKMVRVCNLMMMIAVFY
jgi:hypothetical protein